MSLLTHEIVNLYAFASMVLKTVGRTQREKHSMYADGFLRFLCVTVDPYSATPATGCLGQDLSLRHHYLKSKLMTSLINKSI